MWQWVLSQVAGLVILCIALLIFQQKTKRRILMFMAVANVFWIANTLLLENFAMAGVWASMLMRNLVLLYLDTRGKKIPIWGQGLIVLVFVCVPLIITAHMFNTWWLEWVIFGVSLVRIFVLWRGNAHAIKIATIPFIIITGINYVFFLNITAIIVETVALTSIIIFYVRWTRARRRITSPLEN